MRGKKKKRGGNVLKMSINEIKEEWEYILKERLGMLCEDREATPEQIKLAMQEADEHIKKLKNA